jgi:catechol 2,3-dioxygenase-like lactoylglutathione lyase family enzyme
MIGYVTVGTNDIDKARAYYTNLLSAIGAKELMRIDQANAFTMYGTAFGKPALAVVKPHDGEPATVGNGMMVALMLDSRDKVDALYAKALELGSACEGQPGLRGEEGPQAFYGAYFRDLDGNKFCGFRIGPR